MCANIIEYKQILVQQELSPPSARMGKAQAHLRIPSCSTSGKSLLTGIALIVRIGVATVLDIVACAATHEFGPPRFRARSHHLNVSLLDKPEK